MQIRSWSPHPDFPGDPRIFRGCWEYELKSGENTIPHQHEDGQEINIALEGAGRITVGSVTRDLRPGEIVFVPPQTNHFVENPFSEVLRGISIEAPVAVATREEPSEKVTVGDLDQVVDSIPSELDEPQSLQLIIQLFDLAGYLSEQIETAIGLDSETGLETLKTIEKKVMSAVVQISNTYQRGGSSFFHRRMDF